MHSLHGNTLLGRSVATGIKLANTDLKVVITGGDGDGYGIGIGHFIHAMRRNLDLTYVVMDNQIYGLTTGQASPTTMKDARTKSTPQGNVEGPLNPLALALVSGATYVARGFSGEPNHLADLIAGGIQHKGFALIWFSTPNNYTASITIPRRCNSASYCRSRRVDAPRIAPIARKALTTPPASNTRACWRSMRYTARHSRRARRAPADFAWARPGGKCGTAKSSIRCSKWWKRSRRLVSKCAARWAC